tara:strand:+ start:2892 stop:3092 length:201 start_codon:yes stop_codon:yes gene_type:complete
MEIIIGVIMVLFFNGWTYRKGKREGCAAAKADFLDAILSRVNVNAETREEASEWVDALEREMNETK